MTSAVMQAGFAPGPAPQGRMPSGKEKDAAGSAFDDAMRSGAKDQGQTGQPSAGQKPDGSSGRLRPALHTLGQTWQSSADAGAETVAEGDEPANWRIDSRAERKALEDATEVLPGDADDAQDGEDGNSEAGPLPAIALLLETVLRGGDPTARQAAENTGGTLSVAEALAAASGAGASLKSVKNGAAGTEPSEAMGFENALTTDARGGGEAAKAGNRIASGAAELPSQPGASAPEPDQQDRGRQIDRASPDQPAMPREAQREATQPEPSGASAKATVVGMQSMPAPAVNATTAAFLEAISADAVWKPQGAEAALNLSSQARPQPGAVHSLKIQLHPAELGMVTADLRFTGEQLSVELKVESAEAYHRLSSDSETIVKAFRALGYEIDRVMIQQPHNTSQAARADNVDANSGAPGRDPQSTFSGNAGDDGTRSGGRGYNAQGGSDGRHAEGSGATAQDRSSRGLYI
ncbi:chemotaxis protein MotD [Mesorhizobium albiziae]|uniref:Chemotaxis protein MotD n=1 Tax=Neomesorhizobium albiziae TaxID=335020 RepID=A0A1I4DL30_9HYPH|nr:flagellar hook-length control protein FliK [Mesorhizobium albiziae]GLS31321.1 chemotaxis protein MotD [Mesorhizobium albiziae]SFK93773.1 chemotaxis protein MotD [Mesorhizobium albiziae]